MFAAALITLREGLEAALIVGVVLVYLRKIGRLDRQASVWGGVVAALLREHVAATLVLGDRTAAKDVRALLGEQVEARTVLVDEHRSTEQGRQRYFEDNPPRGWRRLLPVGLQTPPCPYDDYVAVVIAERYLKSRRTT